MTASPELESIFSEVLQLPPGEVTDDLSQDSCAQWDSLNHLRLVTEVESSFGVQFTMAEVQEALSIRKFRDLLAAYTT